MGLSGSPRRFSQQGVAEGRVAGLTLLNSPRFLPAFLALCHLDATVALLPPQYGQSELGAIASASGVGLSSIVADEELAEGIAAAIPISRSAAGTVSRCFFPQERVTSRLPSRKRS